VLRIGWRGIFDFYSIGPRLVGKCAPRIETRGKRQKKYQPKFRSAIMHRKRPLAGESTGWAGLNNPA
jgi:hypothetical protein